ncbi:MAG TPA: DUF4911 domain-containing protein [Sulfurihydrogenibium sp.]|uniref:DUF4911 domain-containing protein n=1 Tax=Sulfurihydrogenibium sp. (strain YO3AOP1) TaxID=436114 RepID=UPI0001723E55|nr:DUF4911 domain-containing protein [Sulfurihydrogenibium sp. YO3AOP1]ACD66122.1 hypothetical protein SYO3AOP1_0481 [Sulfurihydrogenibium sp. YO3AOP1]HBT98428.1 DUF4911 domain-containing protein [Sulfurihydrogenibium sp.]
MLSNELLEKLNNYPTKSVNLVIKCNPEKMNFISMVINGYDRICLPRTRYGKEGILDLITSPDFVDDLYLILEDLKLNHDPSLEIIGDLGDNWIIAVT